MKSCTLQPLRNLFILLVLLVQFQIGQGYYTTSGQNVIDRKTGEIVQLRGIGLGGWLLPEGYMWGIRKLDRPRQFEAAIEDLIGKRNAQKFWDTYYRNFVTREDVAMMKSWGVNTIRVPLLASMIQPREGQPAEPPYVYNERNFKILDDFVDWCEALGMGIIWDLHGAPGAQNAENISDSDGTARLWTEKDKYFPLTIDLWDKITRRYADKACIVGYDLLNEPLLGRYPGVDPGLLREIYVLLTKTIRETDKEGIIFIEGDDWAQEFSMLEPMDWDPHLVVAFHSYPPTHTKDGLARWDNWRQKYNIPLWHGETGEQDPPWEIYKRSTRLLAEENVGWNWWTHKKFELARQPWMVRRTQGFERILAYWNGTGPRPSRWQAKRWLMEQAEKTHTRYCDFLPGMVASLEPLDPSEQVKLTGAQAPLIIRQPVDIQCEAGFAAVLSITAAGYPINFQWYHEGDPISGAQSSKLAVHQLPAEQQTGVFHVEVFNASGRLTSKRASVSFKPFAGDEIPSTHRPPTLDGELDEVWQNIPRFELTHQIVGERESEADLSAGFRLTWDEEALYLFMDVSDDSLSTLATVDYLQDGIEIYVDADNSKSEFFLEDEFQLRVVYGQPELYSDIGISLHSPDVAFMRTEKGYNVELSILWSALHGQGVAGDLLGLDIHVNDSDGATRNGKLSWHSLRDDAYRSPANFGTVRLVNP